MQILRSKASHLPERSKKNESVKGAEMKQFIVLCSTIILGMTIFNMIMGTDNSSVVSTVSEVWEQGIQIRTETP
jgi:hypothetical protein